MDLFKAIFENSESSSSSSSEGSDAEVREKMDIGGDELAVDTGDKDTVTDTALSAAAAATTQHADGTTTICMLAGHWITFDLAFHSAIC